MAIIPQRTGRSPVCLLALGAGAVDAIFIAAFQILTAAQTGNTILFAVAIAQAHWSAGLNSAVSLAGFIIGGLSGSGLLVRGGWGVARVLALEIAVLSGAMILWIAGGSADALSAPITILATACGMGLQSAVMLHLRASSTTYVTGVLTGFTRGVVSPRQTDSTNPSCSEGLIWLVYFGGAIGGAWLFLAYGPAVLCLPLLCLAAAAGLAAREGSNAG